MTVGQLEVLAALTDAPKTTRTIAAALGTDSRWNDSIRGRLRRLEDRGLLRRTYPASGKSAHWELTQAGRDQLQHAT